MAESRGARFVDWFLHSSFYESRRFGSNSDDWMSDPDRMQRCEDASEYGADGSTHAEYINDWREAIAAFLRYGSEEHRRNPFTAGYARLEASIEAHIASVEAWHEANGSLNQEIG